MRARAIESTRLNPYSTRLALALGPVFDHSLTLPVYLLSPNHPNEFCHLCCQSQRCLLLVLLLTLFSSLPFPAYFVSLRCFRVSWVSVRRGRRFPVFVLVAVSRIAEEMKGALEKWATNGRCVFLSDGDGCASSVA